MVKLISDAQFAQIRQVGNDVIETFGQKPVTYRLDSNAATRWNRDNATQRAYTDKELTGLVVWMDTPEKVATMQRETGAIDFGDGYVLLAYDDCEPLGLIGSNTELLTNPPQDRVAFDGQEYYVQGVVKAGQLKDVEVVVKVYFSKELRNG